MSHPFSGKSLYTFNRLHGVMSQKIELLVLIGSLITTARQVLRSGMKKIGCRFGG
jgi:hypothetical protein